MNSPLMLWAAIPWAILTMILVWRVWQLESRLEAFDMALAQKASCAWVSDALNENLSRCVAGTEQRVKSLAHALGYEWKRTESKEGWERTYAHVTWPNIPLGPQYQRAILVSDRRKADRRKPDDSLYSHMKPVCNECFKRAASATKSPPKKPRRATH